MIKIENFYKSYGDLKVYENFSFSAEDKKITCILGESGCGKTTLLNAVAGVIPYEGTINCNKVSYVFQTARLVPNLTVFQNLELVCADGEIIKEMLKRLNLQDKANAYPKTLSGGQAQRVSLARAFLYDSDVLLLDEPFSSLDLKTKNEVINAFLSVWRTDMRQVLFVTHDIDEAIMLSHRIVVLSGGKAVYDVQLSGDIPRHDFEKERREIYSVFLDE